MHRVVKDPSRAPIRPLLAPLFSFFHHCCRYTSAAEEHSITHGMLHVYSATNCPWFAIRSLSQRSFAEAKAESLAEARRSRRQRKLDQVEIPEDQVVITDEMLGKGGFGEVYLADYNGHNAAAKVRSHHRRMNYLQYGRCGLGC